MGKTVNVGLLGFGTVGSGVARILLEQSELLRQRAGMSIRLARICDLDITTSRGFPVASDILTDDVISLINDPELDIFIELIGGLEPARTFVLEAIQKGKHVITANKALLAAHGHEIFEAAARHGVELGFEASVGGGIPVVKAVKEGLVANRLQTVMGIMNGTANYILSRMTEEGTAFQDVLADAQRLGYAEADPSYDVEGIDTAHKLVIMAMLAFGTPVELSDIYIEGISRLSPLDISFAKEFGYRIKLLAIARNGNNGLELRVHPTMIPSEHLLAQVGGAYNAFYFVGDSVGKVFLYGLGAGQMPTGSAVVADVVDVARNLAGGTIGRVASLGLPYDMLKPLKRRPMDSLTACYYFRFSVVDRPKVLARISGILGDMDISIASVVQKGRGSRDSSVSVVMLTHEAHEVKVREALKRIDSLDVISGETMVIRIEDLKNLEKA
ncbi:MAG: homoserine dehydrogenase [Deltaproteobacteria bacterium]|nr:homoserine dehydrogenase [Deltaproteobacteria bacterium]MBW1946908.1 homoserine dehydrogenase [Deltaproteobacteria bacterium]MBW1967048.1 homoserine dehydrogenase [Deltaproteobacteria bacterium]MBW2097747.1 homoserine dehydrogenase [Deltaproteobacteria bacterium]PXF55568.1 MAG: homoserine dehydrogenase [Deltaproteobacteria bacterium]